MDDLAKEFLMESNENLDQLDRDFVVLEKDPSNRNLLSSIFRVIHTIKGTCGFLNFGKLEKLTHAGESLLSKLRDGVLKLTPEMTSALLSMVDAVRKMLSSIEATGNDGEESYPEIIEKLTALQNPQSLPTQTTEPEPALSTAPLNPSEEVSPSIHSEEGAVLQNQSPQGLPPKVEIYSAQTLPPQEAKTDDAKASSVSDTAIRVDVSLLDKLMNLVGELVLARNQILQFISTQSDTTLINASQRLNLITSELQEGIMKTRMQPIGNVWSKFPRVVRDLALSCGKQVRLEMVGKETELDKSLIEAIKDPLTHIVRNSVDHGIESAEKRREAGKPEEGVLCLKAFHEGGQVNIEISDDGGGIHPNKIREKAISKGLISPEQAERMSEREVLNMIFLPGFSTAEKVTNVSGRGVGMDVVRTNIERINGTIDIQSKPGEGTTLKIKIPLTLAIIPALIITSGKDRYAIPQVSLLELVRQEETPSKRSVEMFQGAPVYRLRGRLLPLVYLNRELAVEEDPDHNSDILNIVVLQAGDREFGLVVDEINDTQEIVVKPLGKQLKHVPIYAGSTIMGDGCVALILDVLSIAQQAHLIGESREHNLSEQDQLSLERSRNRQALLLVRSRDDGRMAIPLSLVSRLEEFPLSSIEKIGGREVVQYRGSIMPLVHLSSIISERRQELRHLDVYANLTPSSMTQVVVYTKDEKNVGFIVEKILDVTHETLALQKAGCRPGISGTMVIQSRVTEILNLDQALQIAESEFLGISPETSLPSAEKETRLHS